MSKSCNVHSFSNTFVVVVNVNDGDVVNETIKIIIGFSVRLRVLEHKHTRSACVSMRWMWRPIITREKERDDVVA